MTVLTQSREGGEQLLLTRTQRKPRGVTSISRKQTHNGALHGPERRGPSLPKARVGNAPRARPKSEA